jgi:hypothetical protein
MEQILYGKLTVAQLVNIFLMYWKTGKTYYILLGNSDCKHSLEDLGLDGTIAVQQIVKTYLQVE